MSTDDKLLQILDEIEQHKIRIYEFPECDSDEDDEFKQQDSELKVSLYVMSCLVYCYVASQALDALDTQLLLQTEQRGLSVCLSVGNS